MCTNLGDLIFNNKELKNCRVLIVDPISKMHIDINDLEYTASKFKGSKIEELLNLILSAINIESCGCADDIMIFESRLRENIWNIVYAKARSLNSTKAKVAFDTLMSGLLTMQNVISDGDLVKIHELKQFVAVIKALNKLLNYEFSGCDAVGLDNAFDESITAYNAILEVVLL